MNVLGRLMVVGILLVMAATASAQTTASAKKVRLFILSGQSNMVGLRPETSFTPAMTKAFANDEVIVVKHAVSGQPIRFWYKDWKAPKGEKIKNDEKMGSIYDALMTEVRKAMEGKAVPVSVTFVWMQGEADAKKQAFADIYEESLKGVVGQLGKDLSREDIQVVIGRISDCGLAEANVKLFPGWKTVREAQVKYAESLKHGAWVDTDDLNGPKDGLHYDGPGYKKLGERFAEKAIELIQKK